uniref:Uncharacterized protein n=1 Tax=Arundo donax TaxID=35708 RepID=A0A0A8YYX9_ARUDO
MEASVRSAASTIMTRPGTRPSTFMVAGSAIMPAPTMVVDRLNTAPAKEAPLNSWNAASSPSAAGSSRFVGSSGSLPSGKRSVGPPMVIFEEQSSGFLRSSGINCTESNDLWRVHSKGLKKARIFASVAHS